MRRPTPCSREEPDLEEEDIVAGVAVFALNEDLRGRYNRQGRTSNAESRYSCDVLTSPVESSLTSFDVQSRTAHALETDSDLDDSIHDLL